MKPESLSGVSDSDLLLKKNYLDFCFFPDLEGRGRKYSLGLPQNVERKVISTFPEFLSALFTISTKWLGACF